MVYAGMMYQQTPPAPSDAPAAPAMNQAGSVPNCRAAAQAAAHAAAFLANLDQQAQTANATTATTIEQAERDVSVFEAFVAEFGKAGDKIQAAAAMLDDVDAAIANADALVNYARRILDYARANNNADAVDLARQVNDAAMVLADEADKALAQFRALFASYEFAKRSLDGLTARTAASVANAGYQETRANFEALAQTARNIAANSDDALARFARAAGVIVLVGLAAVVALIAWRFR